MFRIRIRIRVFWQVGIRIRSEHPDPGSGSTISWRYNLIELIDLFHNRIRAKPASGAQKCFKQGRIIFSRTFYLWIDIWQLHIPTNWFTKFLWIRDPVFLKRGSGSGLKLTGSKTLISIDKNNYLSWFPKSKLNS